MKQQTDEWQAMTETWPTARMILEPLERYLEWPRQGPGGSIARELEVLESVASLHGPYALAFDWFRDSTNFVQLYDLAAVRVAHPVFHYQTRLHLVGYMGHGPDSAIGPQHACLVDLTPSWCAQVAPGPHTAAQESAFLCLHKPAGWPQRIHHRFTLELFDNGRCRLERQSETTDWQVFCAAVSLYRWRAQRLAARDRSSAPA